MGGTLGGASGRTGTLAFDRRIGGAFGPTITLSLNPSDPRSPASTSGP